MSLQFEELDFQQTESGELILRRRRFPATGDQDIYEVILNDEFLMSSLFVDGEVALSNLALAEVRSHTINVLVGGLGLGYTTAAALADERVSVVHTIEVSASVIGWHKRGLLPTNLNQYGERCTFKRMSFFECFSESSDLTLGQTYNAILLDIDHSPRHVLQESHRDFYAPRALLRLHGHLYDGGVFGLWSNDPPDDEFLGLLQSIFDVARAEVVVFDNPLNGNSGRNTIYIATKA